MGFSGIALAAFDFDRPDPATHGHRQKAYIGSLRNSRQFPRLRQHARVELPSPGRLFIFVHRKRSTQSQDSLGAKSGIGRLEPPERPEQKTRRDQENDRSRHFGYHECRSKLFSSSSDALTRSLPQPAGIRVTASSPGGDHSESNRVHTAEQSGK